MNNSQRVSWFIDGPDIFRALSRHSRLKQYQRTGFYQLARYYLDPSQELSDVFLFTHDSKGGHFRRVRGELFFACQKRFGVKIIKERSDLQFIDFKDCSNKHAERDMGAMACEMFFQAYSDTYDRAMLFSSDPALVPAVAAMREMFPTKEIYVVSPPGSACWELYKLSNQMIPVKEQALRRCQLPRYHYDPFDFSTLKEGFVRWLSLT